MNAPVETAEKVETHGPSRQLTRFENSKVAIVHHWFVSLGGGERVVDAIASLFRRTDVFTLFLDKRKLPPGLQSCPKI